MKLRNYILPVFMAAAGGMLTGGFLYHIAATPERMHQVYPSLSDSDAKKLSVTQAEEVAGTIFLLGLGVTVRNARERERTQAQSPASAIKPPDPW